ncbi:MAG TPA: SH3 domain-containing protein [Aggregatilineales bacterium]|nr:SH3 domain-containing protein [Aggregatilineales bacterium]
MLRRLLIAAAVLVTLTGVLLKGEPARANVDAIVLVTRTCGTVDAFVTYDTFSEGNPPFWAVFTVDLNGNGVFGDSGEPSKYVRVIPGSGQSTVVGAHLTFRPLPEGSTIAVTVYEVDSSGVAVSGQLPPVEYVCAHKPARNPLPPNTGIVLPQVGIVAKIIAPALQVHEAPNAQSAVIGGLPNAALVDVNARNERGDWLQISFRGGTGWIMWETNAILLGPYADLPVLPNVENSSVSS